MANRHRAAVMNNRRPSRPPSVRLDTTAGIGMKPSVSRVGE